MVDRPLYMKKLQELKDKQVIKVVTGIRRCGKSTLLKMFQSYLSLEGILDEQIISINFENMDYSHLRTAESLYDYISKQINPDKPNYIFLDEIQLVSEFPRVVDSLFIRENTDIYITGSNADILSSELSTLLSGRYIEIKMLPYSFKEYLDARGNDSDLEQKYSDYLQFGSFPYAVNFVDNPSLADDYLQGILNTVIVKDITRRHNIQDITSLEDILRFLFDNIGSPCSYKRISDTLTLSGRNVSVPTVSTYIKALMESFIIYEAKRYDIKGRRYLKSLQKYYVADIGLRNSLLGNKGTDIGHILENVIYLELLRRGNKVFVGKTYSYEVDFIALSGSNKEYYQVAATVRDQDVLERELRPLRTVKDHFPKTLLTLDNDPDRIYDGIKVTNALRFLTES